MSIMLAFRKGGKKHQRFLEVRGKVNWYNYDPDYYVEGAEASTGIPSYILRNMCVSEGSPYGEIFPITKRQLMELADNLNRHLIKKDREEYVKDYPYGYVAEGYLWSQLAIIVNSIQDLQIPEEECEVYFIYI